MFALIFASQPKPGSAISQNLPNTLARQIPTIRDQVAVSQKRRFVAGQNATTAAAYSGRPWRLRKCITAALAFSSSSSKPKTLREFTNALVCVSRTGGVHTYVRISQIRRQNPSQPPSSELGSRISAKSRLAINDATRGFPPVISSHSSGVASIPLSTNRAAQFTAIPAVPSVSIRF